jgi:hypothetical protein
MMKKLKMLWMPVLLGTLLTVTLVGVAGARPNARPEASPALVDYMFSAHHCIPWDDTTNWSYGANGLVCDAATCLFACPIKPPHEGLIRVQRLAMYAGDKGAGGVCLYLTQAYPKTAGWVCRLTGCTTDNPADVQVCAFNPANFKVSVLQDIYVRVTISGTAPCLYGFKLKYEPL